MMAMVVTMACSLAITDFWVGGVYSVNVLKDTNNTNYYIEIYITIKQIGD
jgi:cell division protein FtsX